MVVSQPPSTQSIGRNALPSPLGKQQLTGPTDHYRPTDAAEDPNIEVQEEGEAKEPGPLLRWRRRCDNGRVCGDVRCCGIRAVRKAEPPDSKIDIVLRA